MAKKYDDSSVYAAAKERLRFVYGKFDQVCVAFSGGKDSTVTLHLALEVAHEMGRLPVHALFIDLEAQYQATIELIENMFGREEVRPWWICLPINLRNASSAYEPFWCTWEPGRESEWVRQLPDHPGVVSDSSIFPFYRYRMEFEDFVSHFNAWLARDKMTAFLVGIRADESIHRYLAVKRASKKCAWRPPGCAESIPWSSRETLSNRAVTFFPIYDWRFEDIWRYIGERGLPYNRIYDSMYRAGVPFSQMRICQPYGDDQRKGLDLFHQLEPETWFRIVRRVEGANYAAHYCRQRFLGNRGGLGLPDAFRTWRQYSEFLLVTLPQPLRQVYEQRIQRFIDWWAQCGYPLQRWPDSGIPALENRRQQPSWRRVALALLKQDMARSLSFGRMRNGYGSLSKLDENL